MDGVTSQHSEFSLSIAFLCVLLWMDGWMDESAVSGPDCTCLARLSLFNSSPLVLMSANCAAVLSVSGLGKENSRLSHFHFSTVSLLSRITLMTFTSNSCHH
ncbi:hypothetical protein AOLI_G00070890 [Acnodon oligacanthus]